MDWNSELAELFNGKEANPRIGMEKAMASKYAFLIFHQFSQDGDFNHSYIYKRLPVAIEIISSPIQNGEFNHSYI